jgi:hypothetical protein
MTKADLRMRAETALSLISAFHALATLLNVVYRPGAEKTENR